MTTSEAICPGCPWAPGKALHRQELFVPDPACGFTQVERLEGRHFGFDVHVCSRGIRVEHEGFSEEPSKTSTEQA